jgi:hypothetical protein
MLGQQQLPHLLLLSHSSSNHLFLLLLSLVLHQAQQLKGKISQVLHGSHNHLLLLLLLLSLMLLHQPQRLKGKIFFCWNLSTLFLPEILAPSSVVVVFLSTV